jgi:hypothetical protein
MDYGFGNWAAFSDEILAKEDDKASALTMPPSAPPTAMLPTPHRPTTYKDAVLTTMGGSLCAKSSVVALLSRQSTTVDNQPQTACCCSQPHCHAGRRHHGPGFQSTGAHSSRVVTLAPRSQSIYCEWMGLSSRGGILLLPVLLEARGEFIASCSVGGTWAILLFPGSFGGTFWETNFLVEGCLLFVFLSFGSFG